MRGHPQLGERRAEVLDDVVEVRVVEALLLDQLAVRRAHRAAERHVWVQEEPENMGAWSFMLRKFRDHKLEGITRRESSVTATGFHRIHEIEQAEILHQAFV